MVNHMRVKDVATDLMELSMGTGYDYDHLCLLTEIIVQKYGRSYDEAVNFISCLASSGRLRIARNLQVL